jgi:putative NADH-flavin reductase
MQITIFGASRGVGRAAVDAALAAGHAVTAFARTAGTLGNTEARVVTGDVLDAGAVRGALVGADAVLVSLGVTPGQGGSTPKDICSRGTRVILEQMRPLSIDRIVVVTSYGVGETKKLTPFPFNLIAKTILRSVMEDKELQERELRASGTQWTILQPLGLTDGAPTGKPHIAADGSRASNSVSRADVGLACIDTIVNGRFIGQSAAVSANS